MKRAALKLAPFLLLGAILNIVVAWGCANRPGGTWEMGWDNSEYESLWLSHGGSPQADGPDADSYIGRAGYEGHFTSFWRTVDAEYTDVLIFRAGWPCFSMGGIAMRDWHSDRTFERRTFGVILSEEAWHQGRGMSGPAKTVQRSLPLRPIWTGFAIDTLFYAAILWLLFTLPGVPFALRRKRRIKLGLCPTCAYPVGTSAVCTECGKAVKR